MMEWGGIDIPMKLNGLQGNLGKYLCHFPDLHSVINLINLLFFVIILTIDCYICSNYLYHLARTLSITVGMSVQQKN